MTTKQRSTKKILLWIVGILVIAGLAYAGYQNPQLFTAEITGGGDQANVDTELYIPSNYTSTPGETDYIEVKAGQVLEKLDFLKLTLVAPISKIEMVNVDTAGTLLANEAFTTIAPVDGEFVINFGGLVSGPYDVMDNEVLFRVLVSVKQDVTEGGQITISRKGGNTADSRIDVGDPVSTHIPSFTDGEIRISSISSCENLNCGDYGACNPFSGLCECNLGYFGLICNQCDVSAGYSGYPECTLDVFGNLDGIVLSLDQVSVNSLTPSEKEDVFSSAMVMINSVDAVGQRITIEGEPLDIVLFDELNIDINAGPPSVVEAFPYDAQHIAVVFDEPVRLPLGLADQYFTVHVTGDTDTLTVFNAEYETVLTPDIVVLETMPQTLGTDYTVEVNSGFDCAVDKCITDLNDIPVPPGDSATFVGIDTFDYIPYEPTEAEFVNMLALITEYLIESNPTISGMVMVSQSPTMPGVLTILPTANNANGAIEISTTDVTGAINIVPGIDKGLTLHPTGSYGLQAIGKYNDGSTQALDFAAVSWKSEPVNRLNNAALNAGRLEKGDVAGTSEVFVEVEKADGTFVRSNKITVTVPPGPSVDYARRIGTSPIVKGGRVSFTVKVSDVDQISDIQDIRSFVVRSAFDTYGEVNSDASAVFFTATPFIQEVEVTGSGTETEEGAQPEAPPQYFRIYTIPIEIPLDPNLTDGPYKILLEMTDIAGNVGSAVIPINIGARASGDVSGDGNISMLDVIMAFQIATGNLVPTPSQIQAADMNNDGKVTMLDVVTLFNQVNQ